MNVLNVSAEIMSLHDMIYKRRSVRSYIDVPVDMLTLSKIVKFVDDIMPLYRNIETKIQIVSRGEFGSIFPWTPEHAVAILSEKAEGMYENAGFILQQLELYIQSLGLGACWLGMGTLKRETLKKLSDNGRMTFVGMFVFGYPKGIQQRTSGTEFVRKPLSYISDTGDIRLEPARLAPSGINRQPWFYIEDGNVFHTYCRKTVLRTLLEKTDMTSVGISLSHMYLSNPDTFRFFRQNNHEQRHGLIYCGSFEI